MSTDAASLEAPRNGILVHRVIEWVKINGRFPPMDGASLL